jgi:hypothetical protein
VLLPFDALHRNGSTEVTTLNPTNSTIETLGEILAILAIGSGLAIMLGAWFADLPVLDFLLLV